MPSPADSISEASRTTPVRGRHDIIVAGGGPAGYAAALGAARAGASVLVLEQAGCLGGIWTAGLLPWIIDQHTRGGIMGELRDYILNQAGGTLVGTTLGLDPELLKLRLETDLAQAGVRLRYNTMLTAVSKGDDGRTVTHAITESKAGREAWQARLFIDCTGDGDLAARAGCGFDYGNEQGLAQPTSIGVIVTGIDPDRLEAELPRAVRKPKLCEMLREGGLEPSYALPGFGYLGHGLFIYGGTHQYNRRFDDPDALTAALMEARAEVHRHIEIFRRRGGLWADLRRLGTASALGIREARRIHGRATVTIDDIVAGHCPPRTVCVSHFGLDVHAPDPQRCRGIDKPLDLRPRPYGIPWEALVARDCDNLLMAGRCISGDFLAHSSYRVTGTAVALGEGAGRGAALALQRGVQPAALTDQDLATFTADLADQ